MAPRGITAPRAPCRSCPKVRVKPRGKRTFWKVVAALVVGSLVAEMQQHKIGPFRDMSWKARRYAAVPERPAPATPTLAAATGPDPEQVGGDFSDVAFVGSRAFWQFFARSFDVYAQYERLYSRACTKFQTGQAEDMTRGLSLSPSLPPSPSVCARACVFVCAVVCVCDSLCVRGR
eukprot:COSAG03_NODE_1596_length_3812_cov_18.509022_3_plen_176_part_00